MSGARLTAALECANDAGVRFTLRRPGDSHGASRLSAGAAASCAFAAGPASAVRAAPSEAVATPQSEGLIRVRTQVCFHTPAPVPWGRSRHGRTLWNGIADPVAGVQPQSSQRHTEPLARTSRRRFRAHAPRCRCARAVRHRPPAIGGQVPPPESLSVAAAENDLQSWLRTRESRSIRLGGSRTGTGLRVFALVGRTGEAVPTVVEGS